MRIVSKHEPKQIRQLVAVIYGLPGIGKTSLAMSAEAALLVDTDNGSHRAIGQVDALGMDGWQDFIDLCKSPDLNGYKTLVVDTLDTLLGYAIQYIRDNQAKLRGPKQPSPIDRYSGGLTLAGYGVLANLFEDALKTLRTRNIDLIFVAHAKEVKQDDADYMSPEVTGKGSYNVLRQMADMIGYAEMTPQGRTVHFAPSSRHEGKDPFGLLGSVVIEPSAKDGSGLHIPTGQMARLLTHVREGMSKAVALSDEVAKEMAEIRGYIEQATTIPQCNSIVAMLVGYEGGAIPTVLKPLFMAKTKELGLKWDAEAGSYKSVQEGGGHE